MANSVVIWTKHGENRMSTWENRIVCTKRKDGTFSLRLRSVGEEGVISPSGKVRIRSAQDFIEALIEIGDLIGVDIGRDEIKEQIIPSVEQIDSTLAGDIRNELKNPQHR